MQSLRIFNDIFHRNKNNQHLCGATGEQRKGGSLDTSSSLTSIYMTQLKASQSVELAQKEA